VTTVPPRMTRSNSIRLNSDLVHVDFDLLDARFMQFAPTAKPVAN
jgi:hypothetical protein